MNERHPESVMGSALPSPFFSIIIPVYNAQATIKPCLAHIFSSSFTSFEVIVVDDNSRDQTLKWVEAFPVNIIRLKENRGPSWARNTGSGAAGGEFLIFTDSDCFFDKDLLEKTRRILEKNKLSLLGGTYYPRSVDKNFPSDFQAIFVYYSETKSQPADYLAAHYMVIKKDLFHKTGGFYQCDYFGTRPSCEDVELSHRLRQLGYQLPIYDQLMVRHIFGFNLPKALKNAFKKSFLWTQFSLVEGDLLSDSGTASGELKFTVSSLVLFLLTLATAFLYPYALIPTFLLFLFMLFVNRSFFSCILKIRGFKFLIKAALYYLFPYAFCVGLGAFLALGRTLTKKNLKKHISRVS